GEVGKESTCSTTISDQAPSCVATCSHYSDSQSVGSFGSSRGEEDFSDADDFTMEAKADELCVQEYPSDDPIRKGLMSRVHDRTYKKPDRERKYRCDEQGCGRTFYLPAKLRFISVLKVEASEHFQLISESSTSEKLSGDIAVSSASDPITNESVRDVVATVRILVQLMFLTPVQIPARLQVLLCIRQFSSVIVWTLMRALLIMRETLQ
uniref:Uncharacterized protein n=1 Tax=Parascaris equorum TaxID=6256 RepID=A0A914RWN4_PAREQ